MHLSARRVLGCFVTFVFVGSTLAAVGHQGRVEKYHGALLKRPEPGYLFDQFYNTWLDANTVGELEKFLKDKCVDGDAANHVLLGVFYTKQGRYVDSLDAYQAAVAAAPDDASIWLQKADVEAKTLNFEGAIADLQKARDAKPTGELAIRVAKLEGQAFARCGRRQEALAAWGQLLAASPNDTYLYEDVIELEIEEGMWEEAMETSKTLIAHTSDPYQAVLYRLRVGDIHQRAGEREQALEAYANTLDQVGQDTWLEREILSQIEQVFRYEADVNGLCEYFNKLLDRHDGRVSLRTRYAQILCEVGSVDKAIEQWKKILDATPGDRLLRESYAKLLSDADRLDEAITQVESLIEQHPEDGELLIQLAQLQHRQDKSAEAVAMLQRYLAASDQSEFAFLRTARTLERFQQSDAATEVFEKYVAAFPDSVDAQFSFAEFLYRSDSKDKAKQVWLQVAKDGDVERVLRVARALAVRNEHVDAYTLLSGRCEAFSDHSMFLSELCRSAIFADKCKEALPWGVKRVENAADTVELEGAIVQVSQLADKVGNYDDLIGELASRSEKNAAITCLLAQLYDRRGEVSQADEILASLPKDDVMALSVRARVYRDRRDWAAAIDVMKAMIELPDGRRSTNVRQLIEFYVKLYDVDEALKWIPQWKRLSPGSSSPWLFEAKLYQMAGKGSEALDVLRRGVLQLDDRDELLTALASSYIQQGKMGDAERVYWKLYQKTDDVQAKLRWVSSLAQVAETTGKLDRLVETFEARKRKSRTNIEPLLALAEVHRVAGHYEERRQALLDAARVKPDDLTILMVIARVEEAEGEYERAVHTLERAAELDTSGRVQQHIARVYLAAGEEEKAFAVLFDLAGGERIDARSAEGIADAMAAIGEWRQAAEFLAKQVARFPDNYRLAYLYGIALEEDTRDLEATEVFSRVLKMDQEIPGKAANTSSPPWAAYVIMLETLVPADTIVFLEQSWLAEQAYSHVSRGGYYPGMGASARAVVAQPGSIDEAHGFALAHLRRLCETLDDAEKQLIVAEARTVIGGVADVLFSLPIENRVDDVPYEVVSEFGDQPGVAGLWVLMNVLQGRPSSDSVEFTEKCHKMFAEKRPELALMALIVMNRSGEDNEKAILASLEDLAELKNPNLFTAISLVGLVGHSMIGEANGKGLSDEGKERVRDILLDWYPRVAANGGQQQQMLFMYIASLLSQQEDHIAFVEFLDREITNWQSAGAVSTASPFGLPGYSRGAGVLTPLTGTAADVPGFPPHVAQMLTRDGIFSYAMEDSEAVDWSDPSILGHIKDPLFRAYLACQSDDREVFEKHVLSLLKAKQASIGVYMLAAAFEGRNDNMEKAISLLNTARYLPMTRQLRRRIDGAIVAYALEDTQNEAVATAGREAGLRLRRMTLDVNERMQLVTALEELDLKEEAEQLAAEQSAASGSGISQSGTMGFGGSSGYSRNNVEQIQKLLDEGKKEQAVKIAKRQYDQWARERLGQNYGNWYNYQTDELLKTLKSYGVVDDVLDATRPKQGCGVRRAQRFAGVCQLLNKDDEERKWHEYVITQKSDNTISRLRLAMITVESDIEAAVKHLQAIRERDRFIAMSSLTNAMHGRGDNDIDRMLTLCNLGIRWIESAGDSDEMYGLAESLVETIRSPIYGGERMLPHLYDPNAKVDDRDAKLNERRHDLHDKLCTILAKSPVKRHRLVAFKARLAMAEAKGKDWQEFVPLAEELILSDDDEQRGHRITHYFSSYSSDQFTLVYRSPEELVVLNAYKVGDETLVSDRLVAKLYDSRRAVEASGLEKRAALYFCEKEKFVDVATDWIEFPMTIDGTDAVAAAIDAWTKRDIAVSITPLLVKQAKDAPEIMQSSCLVDYVKHLKDRKGHAAVLAFFETLAEETLGPAEKRQEIIRSCVGGNRFSSQSKMQAVWAYRTMLMSAVHTDALMFDGLERLREFPQDSGGWDYEVKNACEQVIERAGNDPELVIELLSHPAWSNGFDEFRSYAINGDGEQPRTLFVQVLRAASKKPAIAQKVQQWIDAQPTQTFGLELASVMLSDQSTAQKMFEVFGHYVDGLRSADDAVLSELSAMFYPNWVLPNSASAQAHEAFRLVRSNRMEEETAEVKAFLAVKRAKDLPFEAYQLDDTVVRLLASAITIDPTMATQVIDKTLDLRKEMSRSGYFSHYRTDGGFLGEIVAEVMREHASPEVLGFVLKLARDSVENPIAWESRDVRRCILRMIGKNEDIKFEQFRDWVSLMEPCLPDGDLTMLHPALCGCLHEMDTEELEKLKTWATSANDEPTQRLRAEISDVLKLRSLNGERDIDHVKAMTRRYCDMVLDQKVSACVRFDIANHICFGYGRSDYGNSIETAVTLIAEMLADERVHVPRIDEIIQKFCSLERSDDWYTKAHNLLDAYLKCLAIEQRNPSGRAMYYREPPHRRYSEADVILPTPLRMLKIALELERWDSVNQILSDAGLNLGATSDSWTLLVRYGRYEEVSRAVRKSVSEFDPKEDKWLLYDEMLHTQLPEFLAQFKRDDLRYLAELALSVRKDSSRQSASEEPLSDASGEKLPKCGERVIALAKRYTDVDFANEKLSKKAISCLLGYRGAVKELQKPLVEMTADFNPVVTVTRGDRGHYSPGPSDADANRDFLKARYTADIMCGKPEVFVAAHEKLWAEHDAAQKENEHSERHQFVHYFLESIDGVFIREILSQHQKLTADQLKPYCKVARTITSPCGPSKLVTNKHDAVVLAMHIVCDEMDAFSAWHNGFCDKHRKQYDTRCVDSLWQALSQITGPEKEPSVEKRKEIIRRVLSNQWLLDLAIHQHGTGGEVFGGNILTPTEWVEHGPGLAEAFDTEGIAWAELAIKIKPTGNEDLRKSCIEKAVQAKQTGGWSAYRMATLLRNLGERDHARKVAGSIKLDKDQKLKRAVSQLLGELNAPVEQKKVQQQRPTDKKKAQNREYEERREEFERRRVERKRLTGGGRKPAEKEGGDE